MCSQMVTEASRNTVLAPSPHLSPHQRVKVWRLLPLARQTANPSLSFRRSSPTLLPSEELHSLLPSSSSCPLLHLPPLLEVQLPLPLGPLDPRPRHLPLRV